MERTDNLTVELIQDKQQFIKDLICETEEMDGVISIDMVSFNAEEISGLSTASVISQATKENNRFVWLKKRHI